MHEAIEFEVLRTGFRPKLYAAISHFAYIYKRTLPLKVRKKIRKALGPFAPRF
jgi:hypothetical protein